MDYTHLTREQRYQIESLLLAGHSRVQVARLLGRHPSTIGRELKRNRHASAHYQAATANAMALERAKACANGPRVQPASWERAVEGLREGWSPEETSGRLRMQGCVQISHSTIYRRVRADRQAGGCLWRHLRCRTRRLRCGDGRRRARPLGGKPIDLRPTIVEGRSTFGHWEGDTVIDTQLQGAIVTLIERKSRYFMAAKVKQRKAALVRRAINRMLEPWGEFAKTLTLDNGKEFSQHDRIKADCYFAKPFASWQRGAIENANGLLREYFPRSRRLSKVRAKQVQAAQDKLNHRPRKCLGYRTPHEVLIEAFKALHFER